MEICGVTGRFQYFYLLIDGFIPILFDDFVLSLNKSDQVLLNKKFWEKIEIIVKVNEHFSPDLIIRWEIHFHEDLARVFLEDDPQFWNLFMIELT